VLMASIGLLMLVLTAPIFLLLGIHPTTGRRVFLKWAELCVGTLIKRVAYAAFLSVVMTVMGILLAGALRIGWGVAAALAVAVFVAGLIYRKPFMAIFSAMGSFSMSTSGESGMGSRLAAGLGGAYLGSRLARRQTSPSAGGAPGVAVPASRSLFGGAHQGAMPASAAGGTPGVNGAAGKAGMNGAGGAGGAAGAAAAPGSVGAAAGGATVVAGAALAGGAVAAEKLRGPMNELAAAAEGSDRGGSPGGVEVAATAAGAHLRHLHGGRSPIPAETVPTRSLNGHDAEGGQP
jgi:type IV secretory pathway VirB6-like protein